MFNIYYFYTTYHACLTIQRYGDFHYRGIKDGIFPNLMSAGEDALKIIHCMVSLSMDIIHKEGLVF